MWICGGWLPILSYLGNGSDEGRTKIETFISSGFSWAAYSKPETCIQMYRNTTLILIFVLFVEIQKSIKMRICSSGTNKNTETSNTKNMNANILFHRKWFEWRVAPKLKVSSLATSVEPHIQNHNTNLIDIGKQNIPLICGQIYGNN